MQTRYHFIVSRYNKPRPRIYGNANYMSFILFIVLTLRGIDKMAEIL